MVKRLKAGSEDDHIFHKNESRYIVFVQGYVDLLIVLLT